MLQQVQKRMFLSISSNKTVNCENTSFIKTGCELVLWDGEHVSERLKIVLFLRLL